MQTEPTPAGRTPVGLNETDRLSFALAAIVTQAQRLPKTSPARTALVVGALPPLLDTLDDLTNARRIDNARAVQLLAAATAADLVRPDDSFAPRLRAKLNSVGVRSLAKLNDDEARDIEAFIAEVAS
jgi:hypothetical protein